MWRRARRATASPSLASASRRTHRGCSRSWPRLPSSPASTSGTWTRRVCWCSRTSPTRPRTAPWPYTTSSTPSPSRGRRWGPRSCATRPSLTTSWARRCRSSWRRQSTPRASSSRPSASTTPRWSPTPRRRSARWRRATSRPRRLRSTLAATSACRASRARCTLRSGSRGWRVTTRTSLPPRPFSRCSAGATSSLQAVPARASPPASSPRCSTTRRC
mmetsp:Transcript_31024/g.73679  ORF Transcript_31024/g.73679 Transcript_31024/m.73679 type:complete len:217 (-) Transcript_31024:641-1291(-)